MAYIRCYICWISLASVLNFFVPQISMNIPGLQPILPVLQEYAILQGSSIRILLKMGL